MTSRTGYQVRYLNSHELKRIIPQILSNSRSERPNGQDPYPEDKPYPEYGYTVKLLQEEKQALIRESCYLCSKATSKSNGTYDKMDSSGFLYLNDGTPVKDINGNHRKLYKHCASNGMYFGSAKFFGPLKDDEPPVIKKITFKPRIGGNYNVTGLYAPAGEVIKVEISENDLKRVGTVKIHLGQCLYNGQPNNIWDQREMNRMPVILNTMDITPQNSEFNSETKMYIGYIGSFYGGPIYVCNCSSEFTVTISGAVNYRHFILNFTTRDEFEQLCKSSAPYFDLEIWENGVLFSGPVQMVRNYTYDDLYKAAVLWEKISLVSNQVRNQGIVFLYDCFVAAGGAVAFPGRWSVNCPAGWLTEALNYNSFVTNGSWGNCHEYNHNFQGYGFPGGGEVTNNALNLVSYCSFTKISSNRQLNSSGEVGLGAWNAYTSSSNVLRMAKEFKNGNINQLALYATLIHNIGQTSFMAAVKKRNPDASVNPNQLAGNSDQYYRSLCYSSGYDMTFFFDEIALTVKGMGEVSQESRTEIQNQKMPMFVPIGCVYQVGRSVQGKNMKKSFVKTEQPFEIMFGKPFAIDLRPYIMQDKTYQGGSMVLPDAFDYVIKNISNPPHGTLTKHETQENTWIYNPDPNYLNSGEIYVIFGITKKDNSFIVDDIDLVIEFQQSHEFGKNVLERTIYQYNTNQYQTAKAAYENNYDGYIKKYDEPNINPTQNSNTDVWVPKPSNNAVFEIRGKFYIAQNADYRIQIRGRHSVALYVSTDNAQTFHFAAEHNQEYKNPAFPTNEQSSYIDLTDCKKGDWIYFKEILLVNYDAAFIGLGTGKLEKPRISISNNQLTYEGPDQTIVIEGKQKVIKSHSVITKAESDLFKPTATISYAHAYNTNYQLVEQPEFQSEYLFKRHYDYKFDPSIQYNEKGKLLESSPFVGWDENQGLGSLFDDNENNQIHNNKWVQDFVSEKTPFYLVVDLEKEIEVNQMVILGSVFDKNQYQPKNFKLYGGLNRDNLEEIVTVTNSKVENKNVVVNFPKSVVIRYYKFVCTQTYERGSGYISFRCLKFQLASPVLSNGSLLTPDNEIIHYEGNWTTQHLISTFGRICVGQISSTATLTFNGTRFAIFSLYPDDVKIDITVDGNKAFPGYDTNSHPFRLVFLSQQLQIGEHNVQIKCLNVANVEAIAIW